MTSHLHGVANRHQIKLLFLTSMMFIIGATLQPMLTHVSGQQKPATTGLTGTHEQKALAALELSMIAIRSQQPDVSMLAVRKAIQQGPPVATVKISGLLGGGSSRQRANISSGSQAETAPQKFQREFATRLVQINTLWLEKKVDPLAAYETWKAVVFPNERPGDAMVYAVMPINTERSYNSSLSYASRTSPTAIPTAVHHLVQWAKEAGQQDDLLKTAEARALSPSSSTGVCLTKLLLSADKPAEQQVALAKTLLESGAVKPDSESAPMMEVLLGIVSRLPTGDPDRIAMNAKLREITSRTPNWFNDLSLRRYWEDQHRLAIRSGAADADDLTQLMFSQLDGIRNGNESYIASIESRFFADIAADLAKLGKSKEAFSYFKKSVEAGSLSGNRSSSTIISLQNALFLELLKTTPEQRYDLLSEHFWSQPMLGIISDAVFRPVEGVPELFVNPSLVQTEKLFPNDSVATTGIEWMMRDAIAAGKSEEIEERIAKLKSSSSDDALLAEVIWLIAQSKPVDPSLVTPKTETKNAEGEVEKFVMLLPKQGLTGVEVELARRWLQTEETRPLGLEYAAFLKKGAKNPVYKSRVEKLESSSAAEKPNNGKLIPWQDWVSIDETAPGAFQNASYVPSVWQTDGKSTWKREAGSTQNTLLMKYPIQGDVTIKVDFAEGNRPGLFLGGFEFGVRNAEYTTVSSHLNRTAMNFMFPSKIEFKFKHLELASVGEELKFQVPDQEVQTLTASTSDFPFLGIGANGNQQFDISKIEIVGSPTIPRSVEMLTPTMLGWAANWHGSSFHVPESLNFEGRFTEQGIEEGVVNYDWKLSEGVLESINHKQRAIEAGTYKPDAPPSEDAPKYRRQDNDETWIRYLRPLLSGEEISFEFFYDKDAGYSFSPTIDRVAYLLESDGVMLHWLTSEPTGIWHGVKADNKVALPQEMKAEQLELKDKSWNSGKLHYQDKVLTMEVNGKTVVRQTFNSDQPRTIGLFQNPKAFQVRARKMQLTGPWPETLSLAQ